MADLQPTSKDAFFSSRNEFMLRRLLTGDFQRRLGGDLTERQSARLEKTIHHYMEQVAGSMELRGQPVQVLNREVLQAVVPDFMSYIQRAAAQSRPTQESEMDRIRQDVTSRFDQMQESRMAEQRPALPAPPSFSVGLDDEPPMSMSRFEELKKQREAEARRQEEAASAAAGAATLPPELVRRIQSDDEFRSESAAAASRDFNALALRDSARAGRFEQARNELLPVPPDGRALYTAPVGPISEMSPRNFGLPNANPTLSLPDGIRTRGPLPQDNIKAQDDVVTYRETEYNLYIYSADRDWVNNTTENRYQFSVNFDPANNRPGFNMSPSTYIRFKNISRIELVKVIMPTEACETLTLKDGATSYDTNKAINVLSYPYLQVRIDELNTNGFGTNDGLNNSFGVISYDAYWASDTGLKGRGWTRMIPKFLKNQKVYHPTPLATLNKLTIQIQKPDGTLFCDSADSLDVSGILLSSLMNNGGATNTWARNPITMTLTNVASTNYTDASGEFLWINTKAWFSQYAITQGDRIVLKNLTYPSTFQAVNTAAATDFLNFLQRPEGHIVVDIAQVYRNNTTLMIKTGSNKVGYSNYIIIRNKFPDPTTGSSSVYNFGTTLTDALSMTGGSGPGLSTGRLLNLNHQIQLIFRVITRDYDSSTKVRPDNL